MATIGRINTIVSATTKPFTTGLSRAGTALTSFTGKLTGMAAKFTPLAAGLGGTAALFKGFSDTIESGKSLTKLSAQTGESVEELSRFQAVASRLSIDNDDLTGSIEELNIRLGETLRDGTGPAAEALKNLGVDAQALSRMPLAERFGTIADELNKIKNPASLQFLADEIFGGDAFKILPLIKQGSSGIQEMGREAERLGLTMTQGQVESAAKIGQTWNSLKTMGSATFRDIAGALIGSLDLEKVTAFATGFRQSFLKIVPVIKQFGNVVMSYWKMIGNGATALWNMLGFGGGSTFNQLKDFAFDAFAVMEFAFQNVGPIAALMWEKIKLGAVSTWENTKHLFGTQIPTIISWLSGNWRDIFTTIFDFTTTVFINLGKNIRSAMKSIWDFIKSGGRKSLNITWTPLTQGFKNAVKELPDIPDRAMSELEKKLTTNVATMGSDLGEKLGEHLAMRRGELLGEGKTAEFQEIVPETANRFEVGMSKQLTGKLDELEGVAAVQRGSGDAFSAIFKAMRGEGDKGLKAQEQTAKGMSQAVTQLKKIASKPPVQFVAGEV